MKLFFWKKKPSGDKQQLKEAYFTASQGQLIRTRFKKNRSAKIAAWVLTTMILCGFFADFLSPYSPDMSGRDKQYENGPPQFPIFGMKMDFPPDPFSTPRNVTAQSTPTFAG